jgi:hypothetical protein
MKALLASASVVAAIAIRGRLVLLVAATTLVLAITLSLVTSARWHHVTHADATGLVVVPCPSIASAVDGNAADPPSAQDLDAACGRGFSSPSLPPTGAISIASLAKAIGNRDGVLEASDFAGVVPANANQISGSCTSVEPGCTLDVFAFVDAEATVRFDAPPELTFVPYDSTVLWPPTPSPSPTGTLSPTATGTPTATPTRGYGIVPVFISNGWTCDLNSEDADCSSVPSGDGDGVVLAGLIVGPFGAPSFGSQTISVSQGASTLMADISIVGPPTNTPAPSATPNVTASPTSTSTVFPTSTPTVSSTPVPTDTATTTNIPTATATPTSTNTPTATATATPEPGDRVIQVITRARDRLCSRLGLNSLPCRALNRALLRFTARRR